MTMRDKIAATVSNYVSRGGDVEKAADAIMAALLESIKPLVWEDKTAHFVENALEVRLGAYMIKLWCGKLGARVEYFGHPLCVFPQANGLAREVKGFIQTHHRDTIIAAFGGGNDMTETTHRGDDVHLVEAAMRAEKRETLVSSFTEREAISRERYNRLLANFPKRKSTVGKHEAQNYVHLENVLEEADKSCPKAADTIRWLLWHDILDAQWYMHMAEMLTAPKEGE